MCQSPNYKIPLSPNQPEQVSLPGCSSCPRAERLIYPNSSSDEGDLNVFRSSATYEVFQRISVDIFTRRSLNSIRSLKKFLTALRSPSYIRMVLLEAIYQLAEQDSETCRWLLQHRHHLEPELNLMQVAQQVAIAQLESQRLTLNQDFKFTSEGKLEVTETIEVALLQEVSTGKRLLLEELLFLRYSA